MLPDRLRGTTPFPEAGEGVELAFRASDCRAIQRHLENEHVRKVNEWLKSQEQKPLTRAEVREELEAFNWFRRAGTEIEAFNIDFLQVALNAGLKDENGKPWKVDIDDIDVPVAAIGLKVLDGLYISVHGETFNEQMERVRRSIEGAAVDTDPL